MEENKNKKSIDVGTYYANQEIEKFKAFWTSITTEVDNLIQISSEETNCEVLFNLCSVLDKIKKESKEMRFMATLLAKQKACENFLKEKGLSEEFIAYTSKK